MIKELKQCKEIIDEHTFDSYNIKQLIVSRKDWLYG